MEKLKKDSAGAKSEFSYHKVDKKHKISPKERKSIQMTLCKLSMNVNSM